MQQLKSPNINMKTCNGVQQIIHSFTWSRRQQVANYFAPFLLHASKGACQLQRELGEGRAIQFFYPSFLPVGRFYMWVHFFWRAVFFFSAGKRNFTPDRKHAQTNETCLSEQQRNTEFSVPFIFRHGSSQNHLWLGAITGEIHLKVAWTESSFFYIYQYHYQLSKDRDRIQHQ